MNLLPLLFAPEQFTENLKYMGLGMLGIFIVIGCIVLLTILLNAVTSGDTDKDHK